MDLRVEGFIRRPVYQRVTVLVILMVLVVAGFYFGIYQGQMEEMSSLQQELVTANAKLSQNRSIAANLPIFRAEYERLQARLKDALSELPDKKEIFKLLRDVGDLARNQGLDVMQFTPVAEVAKDFYAEVPVNLKLRGSYHDVALFFDAVGRLPRIVNIDQLKLGQPQVVDGKTTLSVDCRTTTFRFIDK